MMKEDLEKIQAEALEKIQNSDALEKLNEIRVAYLGKKGELKQVLKGMKDVAPEQICAIRTGSGFTSEML